MTKDSLAPSDGGIDRMLSDLSDEDASVRIYAMNLLVQLAPTTIPHLINGLRDVGKWRICVEALVQIGVSAVPLLIESLVDPAIDAFIYEALYKIGHPAVPLLVQALKSPMSEKRFWTAEVLGTIGASEAIGSLESLIGDPDEDVRRVAAEALSKLRKNQDKDSDRDVLELKG